MELKDCIDFANRTRTCYIATVEGDQPRVRAMGMYKADATGFYFQTESVKALAKQLQKNRKIEVIFHPTAPGPDAGKVMRVSGRIDYVTDPAIRAGVYESRPFLKGLGITGPEDPTLVIFRIGKGEAYFWSMADNMKEDRIERVRFG